MSSVYFIKDKNKLNISRFSFTFPENVTYDGNTHDFTPVIKDTETDTIITPGSTNEFGLDFEILQTPSDPSLCKNAGNYYSVVQITQINQNYIVISEAGTEIPYPYSSTRQNVCKISRRVLEIVPDNCTKVMGQADPTFTSRYRNNVEGETPGFIGSLSREPGETPGTYSITQGNLMLTDNDNFLASNYTIKFISGASLLIQSAPSGGDTP